MRGAGVIACAFVVACGSSTAPRRALRPVTPLAEPAPPSLLQFLVVDAEGAERTVTWEGLRVERGTEDAGTFAFAQRKTVLESEGTTIGWLEPGARVGVAAARDGRVEVVLFAWTGADTTTRVHAWVAAADVGPAPPPDAPPFSAAASGVIGRGQIMRDVDGRLLGFTFCGPVEILDEKDGRARVVQREDGVALEGYLEPNTRWQNDEPCPGLVVLGGGEPELVIHDRNRKLRGALPAGLVEVGPFDGPTFAELAAKRAKVYWLYDGDRGPQCDAWKLVPPERGADEGVLEARTKLDDGDTLVTRYQMSYGEDEATTVILLGPSSEVIAPPGREPRSGGGSLGCGATYHVVARDAGGFTMHRYHATYGPPIRAYDRADTERWYTDRDACERDADARRQRVALAFAPHGGC
jgi:hypothetical protein